MANSPYSQSASDDAVKKASRAVEELRMTIGLPSESLAKEKGVVVEWNVRVIRPGSPVEALCNCTCYA